MSGHPAHTGGRALSLAELVCLGDATAALSRCAPGEIPSTLARTIVDVVAGAHVALLLVGAGTVSPLAGRAVPDVPDGLRGAVTQAADSGHALARQTGTTASALSMSVGKVPAGTIVVGVWLDGPREFDPTDIELVRQLVHAASARLEPSREAMAEQRHKFERSFDGTPYGTLLVSLAQADRGAVIRSNPAFDTLLSPPEPGVGVARVLNVAAQHGTTSLDVEELLGLARRGERVVEQLIRPDQTVVWAWITAVAIEDVEGDDPFLVVHVLDITSQRLQEQALVVLARTDTLTGLANRSVVNECLDDLCQGPGEIAVLMLDLDRFKAINDGHGHHVGDELIVAVARRLESLVPADAVVARIGGDEFVVVMAGRDHDELDQLAGRIVDRLGKPLTLPSGRRVVTGVSLGVTSRRRTSRSELLRDADLAMYRAKDNGGSQWCWCDDELRATSARALDMEERLRRAIERRQLVVYRQPIIRLSNFGLAGHEALVRMRDPEIGLITPADFIPLAEQAGLIADLDHWMLARVLALVATDPRYREDPQLRASINFSAHSLQRDDLVDRIRDTVGQHSVPMGRLILEITESSLLAEPGTWNDDVSLLRSDGLQVSIDDFGTGYSGLTYLDTLRPDTLKIDRAFVTGLDAPQTRAISTVSAIVQMAHAHGIAVVAEGVETDTQADYLRRLGCDYAQGFLYGRPQPWTLPGD